MTESNSVKLGFPVVVVICVICVVATLNFGAKLIYYMYILVMYICYIHVLVFPPRSTHMWISEDVQCWIIPCNCHFPQPPPVPTFCICVCSCVW